MPLSPLDDFLAHQTIDTFDRVFTTDRNFYDRYYFNLHACSDELFLVMGMGQYPNLGTTDAFVCISHGTTQYTVRASRILGHDRLDTRVGPFEVKVLEGLQRIQLILDDNEWGVAFDVTFEGVTAPLQEPRQTVTELNRIILDSNRYAQLGRYEGTLRVGGETYTVTPDRFQGVRNRSWGVRPIGERPAPGIAATVERSAGFFHQWRPMQFDDFMIKVFVEEDENGTRTMEESVKIWNQGIDRPHEPMGRPELEFEYIPGTRELARALIRLTPPGAEPLEVRTTPLRTVYLMAGSGYIPVDGWGHGVFQGDLKVEGLTYDVGDPAVRKQYAMLNETLSRFELSTGEVGYGMHENLVTGVYHPHGFHEPGAVAP